TSTEDAKIAVKFFPFGNNQRIELRVDDKQEGKRMRVILALDSVRNAKLSEGKNITFEMSSQAAVTFQEGKAGESSWRDVTVTKFMGAEKKGGRSIPVKLAFSDHALKPLQLTKIEAALLATKDKAGKSQTQDRKRAQNIIENDEDKDEMSDEERITEVEEKK